MWLHSSREKNNYFPTLETIFDTLVCCLPSVGFSEINNKFFSCFTTTKQMAGILDGRNAELMAGTQAIILDYEIKGTFWEGQSNKMEVCILHIVWICSIYLFQLWRESRKNQLLTYYHYIRFSDADYKPNLTNAVLGNRHFCAFPYECRIF